jgi:FAD/FMN-containing dehydrogenase
LDGVLLLDDASGTTAADDFGHLVHRQPLAVLKPGSVDDVVKLVQFARRNDIKVAARGQAHSTQGQAQVEAGVVVDMSTLATVHEINATDALVDGGTRWFDVLRSIANSSARRSSACLTAATSSFSRYCATQCHQHQSEPRS